MFMPRRKIFRSYRLTNSSNAETSPALAADTSWASSSRTTVEVNGFGSVALTILCTPSITCGGPVTLIWQGTIIFLYHVPWRSCCLFGCSETPAGFRSFSRPFTLLQGKGESGMIAFQPVRETSLGHSQSGERAWGMYI